MNAAIHVSTCAASTTAQTEYVFGITSLHLREVLFYNYVWHGSYVANGRHYAGTCYEHALLPRPQLHGSYIR
jgi:hypothetical protein